MRYDKSEIKKIIEREISRHGQIFYVAPRINDLKNHRKNLIKLFLI